ncbi:MAG: hypothetical protein PHS31_02780 [Victivallaceae bacterium]|nr:hypothetical protein [Victivallaceae bacterium]MDD4180640.1 hypothetical protein [Victivallaceae bacterium]
MIEQLKNLFVSGDGSIIDRFKDLFESSDKAMQNFNIGFASGVGTALLILFLLFLLRLIVVIVCRRKKSSGIVIDGELGEIFISATAITSAVMGLESEFKEFLIQKVRLYCAGRNKVLIWVQLCKDERAKNFVPKAEEFQRRTLLLLQEMFGIDNIEKVDVKLKEPIRLQSQDQHYDATQPDMPVFTPEPFEEEKPSSNSPIPFN